jgi:hypothetical protein
VLAKLFVELPNGVWDYDEYNLKRTMEYWSVYQCLERIETQPMNAMSHAVRILPIHMPGEEPLTFTAGQEQQIVRQVQAAEQGSPLSTLTAYFDICKRDADARQYKYTEMNNFYTYNPATFEWTKAIRRKKGGQGLSIMYDVPPNRTELLAISLLLEDDVQGRGVRGFEHLRTLNRDDPNPENHVLCATFVAAAAARGLLASNETWIRVMNQVDFSSSF